MKKTISVITAAALAFCLCIGVLVGCSGGSGGSNAQLTEYEKVVKDNSLANLIGDNGSLTCTLDTYEDDNLVSTAQYEWKIDKGSPSVAFIAKSTEDNEVEYDQTAYTSNGNGAIYTTDDSGYYAASLYPEGNMKEIVAAAWEELLGYSGEKESETTEGSDTIMIFKEAAGDDSDFSTETKFTLDASSKKIKQAEMTISATGEEAFTAKTIIKDIQIGGTIELPKDPVKTIAECPDSDACKVTVVINDPKANSNKTSEFRVKKGTEVDLALEKDYTLYADEAHKTELEDIDTSGSSVTVYVLIEEEAAEEAVSDGDNGAADDADDGEEIELTEEELAALGAELDDGAEIEFEDDAASDDDAIIIDDEDEGEE